MNLKLYGEIKDMNKIFGRLKSDKDFRYDFFIALWSGIIIVAVVIALIYGTIHFSGKINDITENPKETEKPVETESPSQEPVPSPTPDAVIDDNEGNDDTDNNEDDNDYDNDGKEGEEGEKDDKNDENGTSKPETVYATTKVNIRKEPSASSQSLGKIVAGTPVERIESMSNGWSKVTYDGKTAYIKSEYLTKTKPADNKADAPSTATSRPKSTKAPARTEKPSKPKATNAPTQEDDESDDDDSKDDGPAATPAPASSEPTSVPPVSDNLTGTDIQNYQNEPSNTAKPDGASD